ncbi:ubiquitin thiolesterase, partial [Reticulomyxa filosa]
SFRNLILSATSSKVTITVYVFNDLKDTYFPFEVEVQASAKICVLKHQLKKEIEENNLCLGYVNVRGKNLSELVTVANDQEDVSSFIGKEHGFFCAGQVVDIQQCSSYFREEKTDQFEIIPVLQYSRDNKYCLINFCKASTKSRHKSANIVKNLTSLKIIPHSALFYGDNYIDVEKNQPVRFNRPLSLTIVFSQYRFQNPRQVNMYFLKFLILIMVCTLLKNKTSSTCSFCSLCLRAWNWISGVASALKNSFINLFCWESGNASNSEGSTLMEEGQRQRSYEREDLEVYGQRSVLREILQVSSIFSRFSLYQSGLDFLKIFVGITKRNALPAASIDFKGQSIKESLMEMLSETLVDGSQSFLKCNCSHNSRNNRIIAQKKKILVAPQVLVVKIDRVHPIFGYKPTPIDYLECFKLVKKQYSLTGVCIHVGNTNKHGHYYAFVKNMHNGMCDDYIDFLFLLLSILIRLEQFSNYILMKIVQIICLNFNF